MRLLKQETPHVWFSPSLISSCNTKGIRISSRDQTRDLSLLYKPLQYKDGKHKQNCQPGSNVLINVSYALRLPHFISCV